MRCKNCDYRLWNLTSRQCPECGTPFVPSAYSFVPNSVRFCCPHCSQEYYGTASNGHLVPDAFDCVRCNRHVHMDEMVLLPAEGFEEDQTEVERLAWLDRGKRGVVRAWFAMIGMALVRPGRVMELAPVDGAVGSAWWFAVATSMIVGCIAMIPTLVLIGAMSFASPRGFVAAPFAGVTCFFLLSALVGIALWGLIAHGVLAISGGTRGGIGRTYQAMCFSSGANAVTAIPCVGPYLGFIWWTVSAVIMVKVGQRVGGLRATLAVLLLPALVIASTVYLITLSVRTATTAYTQALSTQTTAVADAILRYAEAHDYHGPDHALVLVSQGILKPEQLTAFKYASTTQNVLVGDGTLDDFASAAPSEQLRQASAAAAALPEDVIAHRVGDYVFTYHGATLNECPAGLWIVIESRDPQATTQTPGSPLAASVNVGKADGSVETIPKQGLAQALQAQNLVRASIGLPPLPDPATVTFGRPAVGPTVPVAVDTTGISAGAP